MRWQDSTGTLLNVPDSRSASAKVAPRRHTRLDRFRASERLNTRHGATWAMLANKLATLDRGRRDSNTEISAFTQAEAAEIFGVSCSRHFAHLITVTR